ncbi:lysine--tRNA ligase [Exiguobacterium sp. s192]|uniref:lysine--tRNA ligase n=1 Tax=Exiguobacterium sp. s192 TaxID=2751206 RepID=UPI001BEA648A|nr:lysine--tRNA ligase [Exiguobacterium sp. s192]
MHWAEETARAIITRNPEKQKYVCAAGISPSGPVHIGNFREVVTTYFVVQALRDLGKDVQFLFSWDDYDRFRKVPADIVGHDRYLGRPYSETPAPTGEGSYARHFEEMFEKTLRLFQMEPEYRYQHVEYRSGRYAELILHAFRERHAIYEILMRYKSATPSEAERVSYFPASVYCTACGTDATTIESFDDHEATYDYRCRCGWYETIDMRSNHQTKLNWKVDWAMRWAMEGVDFEPGGKDHSAANGSYVVSSEIAREIFGVEPPLYLPYEFIRLKGETKKMSSSSGGGLTPQDLLQVYPAHQILFLFAKHRPEHAFHIGIDEDVLRHYAEYERMVMHYERQTPEIQQSLRWSQADLKNELIPFSQWTTLGPMVDFNEPLLRQLLECNEADETITAQVERARQFVTSWCPERQIRIREQRNDQKFAAYSMEEQDWLNRFAEAVRGEEDVLAVFYRLTRQVEKKETMRMQKIRSTMLYELTIDSSFGPRIPLLVKAIGHERFCSLLSFDLIDTVGLSQDRLK